MKRIVCIVVLTSLCAIGAAAADPDDTPPQIRSPKDGQSVGAEGDRICVKPSEPCYRIRVEGWVADQRTPFFAVEPLSVGPRMWIQPAIHGVKADGTFSGMVYLGTKTEGVGEQFKIYLFACADPQRYREKEEVLAFAKDCQVSAPVEIIRER